MRDAEYKETDDTGLSKPLRDLGLYDLSMLSIQCN